MLKRFSQWVTVERWRQFLVTSKPDPVKQANRLQFMERGVVLPVKAILLPMLVYTLFISNWSHNLTTARQHAFDSLKIFFLVYVALNVGTGFLLLGMNNLSFRLVQGAVTAVAFVDGLFLAAMTVVTGGFNSLLYWIFHGLIIRNTIVIPGAAIQLPANLLLCVFFLLAGVADSKIADEEAKSINNINQPTNSDMLGETDFPEPIVLRFLQLVLMTACCYGVQVLFDKQGRAEEEAREFALRQQQLQATGRLAAEIAHQIKNPLAIINNAAFSLQQMAREGKPAAQQQIDIIREEVQRSDRIITELMGYAQLVEGKVEKVNAVDEMEQAIRQAFPPGSKFAVEIHRDYAPTLPSLMAQRGHLNEVFLNLLQNAREAMQGKGNIFIGAKYGEDFSVIVTIADDGPGISPENLEKIFEPYFTTKVKGSGLGLAIVKHNVEIYGGTVRVESELGKGTRFTLHFPARTMMKLRT
ncbi:MAG TPA: ATP-binding protein [Verrucomicrobiae bacterium]|nr:ATP-binding protein [Verrucomicrobiae bacterium]